MGTPDGYSLYSLNSTDVLEPVYKSEERDVYIAERLFSSSLVAVVSGASPRTLRIEHFKKVGGQWPPGAIIIHGYCNHAVETRYSRGPRYAATPTGTGSGLSG